ncbi:MAG TPA: calcium:proton antiporter [Alphaproteobacteria bacterium]|nr:calcium:proton antiporter [Alphaproteobacteria bacterium]
MASRRSARFLGEDRFLIIGLGSTLVFLIWGEKLLAHFSQSVWLVGVFAWLFFSIMGSALAVVRHADHLAAQVGEPFGTLILTLSVTSIEVIAISTAMLHGQDDPALARDTIFSVVMIIMNGMIGLSLLLGGLKHSEQSYNLQGANTYLGVIIPLTVLSLVLPDYTTTTSGPTLSHLQEALLIFIALGLYGAFLAIQTGRHRSYFTDEAVAARHPLEQHSTRHLMFHIALLAINMVAVVILSEWLGEPVDYMIDTLHVPSSLGGLSIAVLVAMPEAVGAVKAARANKLQRSVNIFLGSVLSTISLTIPAMLIISRATGHNIALGLEHTDLVLLLLTLAVSMITFGSGRTNVLQGLVHLLLFVAYLTLLFEA